MDPCRLSPPVGRMVSERPGEVIWRRTIDDDAERERRKRFLVWRCEQQSTWCSRDGGCHSNRSVRCHHDRVIRHTHRVGGAWFVALASVLIACSSSDDRATVGEALPVPGVESVATDDTRVFVPSDSVQPSNPTTTAGTVLTPDPTTTTTTTTITTTTSSTTTTTLPAGTPAAAIDLTAESLVLGTSIEGRPIVAERFGSPGGRRVLVIGVIHGNEDGGVPIVDELRDRAAAGALAPDVEWWLVESMNPDGQAAQDRHNANQVDLNRNFPLRWGPIGQPGDGQYAGTGPASEPETQAMVAFISQLRPDMAIWYHQDANLIIPSTGRNGRVRARYAELSGLPVADCCGGGIYTGIAATWARNELADQNGVPFIVELPGGDLSVEQVTVHADTVATIASELPTL